MDFLSAELKVPTFYLKGELKGFVEKELKETKLTNKKSEGLSIIETDNFPAIKNIYEEFVLKKVPFDIEVRRLHQPLPTKEYFRPHFDKPRPVLTPLKEPSISISTLKAILKTELPAELKIMELEELVNSLNPDKEPLENYVIMEASVIEWLEAEQEGGNPIKFSVPNGWLMNFLRFHAREEGNVRLVEIQSRAEHLYENLDEHLSQLVFKGAEEDGALMDIRYLEGSYLEVGITENTGYSGSHYIYLDMDVMDSGIKSLFHSKTEHILYIMDISKDPTQEKQREKAKELPMSAILLSGGFQPEHFVQQSIVPEQS